MEGEALSFNRIKLAPGMTAEETCRKGLQLERENPDTTIGDVSRWNAYPKKSKRCRKP
jgi:hypothetical protein